MTVDTQPAAATGARGSRRSPGRADAVCAAAVDLARSALDDVAQTGAVGEHLMVLASGERLVTHLFACTQKGYRGWTWAVSLARAPRAKTATVCEVELIAGPDAIQAPVHVPWEDRLRPGDLGADDVLARVEDDRRLIWGFEATGDEDVDAVALAELGLGRRRVLSAQGRGEAAGRWAQGEFGSPSEPKPADEACVSCGFMLPVTGALRPVFGICANEWSPADGHVVTLDYGCGAHSETDVQPTPDVPVQPVVDDFRIDAEQPGPADAAIAVEPDVTEPGQASGGDGADEGTGGVASST